MLTGRSMMRIRVVMREITPLKVQSRFCSHLAKPQGFRARVSAFAVKHAGTIYNVGMTSSLCAFVATDLLTLRCLAVFGTTCAVWFNYQVLDFARFRFLLLTNFVKRAPPWNAVVWGLLFIGVNVFRITQILLERRTPNFSAEELDIFSRHFHSVHNLFGTTALISLFQ